MKKLLVVVIVLAFAVPCLAQTAQPPKPGPEVQQLGYFVGTWKGDGEVLTGLSKGKYGITLVCEWFPGGFSVVCRKDGTGVQGPINELDIFGYSTMEKAYTWYPVSRSGAAPAVRKMSVQGNTWTCEFETTTVDGKVAKHKSMWVGVSPSSFSYKRERSVDGGPWTQMVDFKATKVK